MSARSVYRRYPFWLLLLLFSVPLHAVEDEVDEEEPMQLGHQAYVSGEYGKAARIWKPLAEQGIAQAQFYLSNLYARGEGVEKDPVAALSWLTRSARAGYPAAQFNLGNRFFKGLWVKQDYGKAREWWGKAAEQKVARAAHNIGGLYYQGTGVEKNIAEALRWYRRAADGGSIESKVVLAKLESRGRAPSGVHQAQKAAAVKPEKGKATAPPKPKVPVVVSTPEESATWIREQPAKHFTIQLFAANAVPAIEEFLQGFDSLDRLAVFGFARDNKPYFAVIHGSYPTKADANARAASLTGASTWIRSFGGIRKIMVE